MFIPLLSVFLSMLPDAFFFFFLSFFILASSVVLSRDGFGFGSLSLGSSKREEFLEPWVYTFEEML